MPTLVSDIISGAFRESNISALTQSRSAEEIAEALARLQAIVYNVLGGDVGYVFDDWAVANDAAIRKPNNILINAAEVALWTVPPNARLVCGLTEDTTLKLDPNPRDGQRVAVVDAQSNMGTNSLLLDPNGRKIEGAVTEKTLGTDDLSTQWFYRADLADWTVVSELATDDNFPFPPEFDDYFIITLAMRLNPRYGRELPKESAARLAALTSQITNRYAQNMIAHEAPQGAPQ